MKKMLTLFAVFLTMSAVRADIVMVETNLNMDNFWQKNGKEAEKVLNIGRKLIHDNELKRVPIFLCKDEKTVNATSNSTTLPL